MCQFTSQFSSYHVHKFGIMDGRTDNPRTWCLRRPVWPAWWTRKQVRQQDAYPPNEGAIKTMCNTPPFQWQHLRRSLLASIYSTQGIDTDVSARLPNTTAAACDLDLWSLDPDVDRSRPCSGEDLCQFALKSVHSFSNQTIAFTSWQQTNEQTDGWTKGHVENMMPRRSDKNNMFADSIAFVCFMMRGTFCLR